jgi:hypothetical protein
MNDLPGALEMLLTRVNELERRVHSLEHPGVAKACAEQQPVPITLSGAIEDSKEEASGMFLAAGKAMLGIAGAYVLRAMAQSGALPKAAITAVAIAYAIAWLLWAARASGITFMERTVYACTSALILAPMLWELTLQFKVLSPTVTASLLAAYVVVATAIAWSRECASVFWVAHISAALTSLVLSIAIHALTPFIAAILLSALLCEYATLRGRGNATWPLVSMIADLAICTQIFVYDGPQNTRADYPALGAAMLIAPASILFLITGVGIAIKAAVHQENISVLENVQAVIAFILTVSSVLCFAPVHGTSVLGAVCLLLSVAGYTATFALFRNRPEPRNYRLFGTWSAALLAVGAILCLPLPCAAAWLGLSAVVAALVAMRATSMMLKFHSLLFLVVASVTTHLAEYIFGSLVGTLPAQSGWSLLVVSACAVSCYALGKEQAGEPWLEQTLHFVPALIATCALAALLAQTSLRMAVLGFTPDVVHIAFIRTLALCSVALALAYGASRWRRLEMTRISYATLAFVAAKLIIEDIRHGQMEFIAGSIFLFALSLIAVSRLARTSREAESATK